MEKKLDDFPQQIDFKTSHTPSQPVMGWIMENSTRVEHLVDEQPRLSRWWFDDAEKVLKAINMIIEDGTDTEYRWICKDLGVLMIQRGEF